MSMLRACLAMLPRIEARENLLAARRVGVGTGSYGKDCKLEETWRADAFPRRRRRMKRVQVDD